MKSSHIEFDERLAGDIQLGMANRTAKATLKKVTDHLPILRSYWMDEHLIGDVAVGLFADASVDFGHLSSGSPEDLGLIVKELIPNTLTVFVPDPSPITVLSKLLAALLHPGDPAKVILTVLAALLPTAKFIWKDPLASKIATVVVAHQARYEWNVNLPDTRKMYLSTSEVRNVLERDDIAFTSAEFDAALQRLVDRYGILEGVPGMDRCFKAAKSLRHYKEYYEGA